MNQLNFSIADPCNENWNNMHAHEQGRFCDSCSKAVIDFTTMTNAQVFKTLMNGDANICGRFSDTQIEQGVAYGIEKQKHWHKYLLGLLLPAVFYAKPAKAQMGLIAMHTKKTKVENTNKKSRADAEKAFEITGKIFDSETSKAIPNVSVMVKHSSSGEVSDADGNFHWKGKTISSTIVLVISAIGYDTKEIQVSIPVNNFKMNVEAVYLNKKVIELETVAVYAHTKTIHSFAGPKCSSQTSEFIGFLGGIGQSVRLKPATHLYKRLETSLTDSLKVYPNPAQRGSNMKVAIKLKEAGLHTLQVIDVSGKVMFQKQVNAVDKKYNAEIACDSRWASGIYFLRVLSSDYKVIRVAKFVVE